MAVRERPGVLIRQPAHQPYGLPSKPYSDFP